MAFGAGSAIAHQAVNGIMGGRPGQTGGNYQQQPVEGQQQAMAPVEYAQQPVE
jgi:hypothetical protein